MINKVEKYSVSIMLQNIKHSGTIIDGVELKGAMARARAASDETGTNFWCMLALFLAAFRSHKI